MKSSTLDEKELTKAYNLIDELGEKVKELKNHNQRTYNDKEN
jgi:hypothetical protein